MMTKKNLVVLSIVFVIPLLMLPAEEGHHRDVDEILTEILSDAGVRDLSGISPGQVPDRLLEELGDSVMGLLLVDRWHHERMDVMLGGEGSERLAGYHRSLGEQYLLAEGDLSRLQSSWLMPASGALRQGMHGFGVRRYPYGWDILRTSVIVLLILLVFIIVVLLLNRRRPRQESPAMQILQNRYARGEISTEEFEHMRQVIR